MKAYTNIDYSSLYGVKPNENDFSGAINRCTKEGLKHLTKNFVDAINDIITQRKMSKQIKFFKKEYNSEREEFELIEIPLNIDNWFYVQLDGTIRTAFFKYGFPYPKYAIIENHTHYMIIELFREDIKDEKELKDWEVNYLSLEGELDLQAKCISRDEEDDIEDWTKIEFKIL